MENELMSLPMVALRGLAVLPEQVTHFDVSREKSVQAITQAMKKDQKVFLDAVNKAIDAAIEEGCCKIRR